MINDNPALVVDRKRGFRAHGKKGMEHCYDQQVRYLFHRVMYFGATYSSGTGLMEARIQEETLLPVVTSVLSASSFQSGERQSPVSQSPTESKTSSHPWNNIESSCIREQLGDLPPWLVANREVSPAREANFEEVTLHVRAIAERRRC